MSYETGGSNPEVAERQTKVQLVAEGLKKANFLRPSDEEKDKLDDNIGQVFGYLKHGVESVTEIDSVIVDFETKGDESSFTEAQVKNLRADREILADAVTIACRDLTATDPELESEFFLGPKHIDGLLGEKLVGLGGSVSKRKGVPEEIGVELDKLEMMRRKIKGGNTAEAKAYATVLKKKIDLIADKDFEGQFETLMALNEELEKYETPSVDSTKTDDELKKSIDKLAKNVEKMSSGGGDRYRQEQERYGLRPIMDADGNIIGMESNYNVSPEHCAKAMKWMASDLRWSPWTPPEWYNRLPPKDQAKVLVMIGVNTAAASLAYAGKDLLKILESNQIFGFSKEDMATLFDGDFKLAMSIMLNDLCEIVPDENGIPSLRYKEVEINGERTIDPEVSKLLSYREDYKEELARKIARENGHWQKYDQNDKSGHKKGDFILNDKGERIPEPNYLDLMNAYTAWNLFYGMGDSSTCDRLRILPTWNGIIADALRTMKKAEFKAKNKLRIWKGGKPINDDLLSAEHFGGNMSEYVMKIMEYENVIGGPINGGKLMRDRIRDGEMPFFNQTLFYGFLDFVNGGRDLVRKDYGVGVSKEGQSLFYEEDKNGVAKEGSVKTSLGKLLMDYAYVTKVGTDGKVIMEESPIMKDGEVVGTRRAPKREFLGKDRESQRRDFSFGLEQVTFMNEFRDSLEGGILAYNCMMSKEDIKTVMGWVKKLKEKMPMVSDIKFNGERAFSYTTNPVFWRDVMVGAFGFDETRLSSDYVRLRDVAAGKPGVPEQSYNLYISDMLKNVMKFVNYRDVDYNELARLLGVQLLPGERLDQTFGAVPRRNDSFSRTERWRTTELDDKYAKKMAGRVPEGREKMIGWKREVDSWNFAGLVEEYDLGRLRKALEEAVRSNQYVRAGRLYSQISLMKASASKIN